MAAEEIGTQIPIDISLDCLYCSGSEQYRTYSCVFIVLIGYVLNGVNSKVRNIAALETVGVNHWLKNSSGHYLLYLTRGRA